MIEMKNLTPMVQLTNVLVPYYTNGTTRSYVKLILVHNTDTVSQDIAIHRVLNVASALGSPVLANRLFAFSILPGDTKFIELPGQGLVFENNNDALFMSSTTSGKVNVTIDGSRG